MKTVERQALGAAGGAIGALSAVALLAGAVRVLPLVVDPELPLAVAAPFAQAVAWLGLEVAVPVGWALGWALAFARFVDRGEARVFALLGQSPRDVLRRLIPQACALGVLAFSCSYLAARDAARPGRVVGELLASSRAECAAATSPRSVPVPFLDARWLCGGGAGAPPRLLVRPARPAGAVLTAEQAELSGDVREVRLQNVHLVVGRADVAVGEMEVRGLPPLLTSATLRPAARAAAVLAAALVMAFGLAWIVLERRVRGRILAVGLACVSAAAAFGALRALDRAGAREILLLFVPVAALAALLVFRSASFLVCLRRKKPTATTS